MIRVGVFGGSGYAGGELLRYLLGHPEVDLRFVTSRSSAGQPIAERLPNLAGWTPLPFIDPREADVRSVEAVFMALEHNASQDVVPALLEANPALKIVDLAGDFRTPDPAGYQRFYGRTHGAVELLPRFVYGFTEAARDRIRGAQLVANPGCFATSLLLGLWPLKAAGLLKGPITAVGITGSTGAGAKPAETTHHPHRATNVRAYKALAHQHMLEVRHFLGARDSDLLFVPVSGPFARGIFTTFVFPGIEAAALGRAYAEAYRDAPLVTVAKGSPELRLVQDTPFSRVGWEGRDDAACGFAAIDNLAKGAATQAIQNFNLMCGLAEQAGLRHAGGFV